MTAPEQGQVNNAGTYLVFCALTSVFGTWQSGTI